VEEWERRAGAWRKRLAGPHKFLQGDSRLQEGAFLAITPREPRKGKKHGAIKAMGFLSGTMSWNADQALTPLDQRSSRGQDGMSLRKLKGNWGNYGVNSSKICCASFDVCGGKGYVWSQLTSIERRCPESELPKGY